MMTSSGVWGSSFEPPDFGQESAQQSPQSKLSSNSTQTKTPGPGFSLLNPPAFAKRMYLLQVLGKEYASFLQVIFCLEQV